MEKAPETSLDTVVVEDEENAEVRYSPSGNILFLGSSEAEEAAYRRRERDNFAKMRDQQLRREVVLTLLAERVCNAFLEHIDDIVPIAIDLIKASTRK